MPKLVNPKVVKLVRPLPCGTCRRASLFALEEVGATTGKLRSTPICVFCLRALREAGRILR